MKRTNKLILSGISAVVIILLSGSHIFAKPTHQDPDELGYGQGNWQPMSYYYVDGVLHDGPSQNFNTAAIIGDPNLNSEHWRLCGEFALAYILRISPEEALRVFYTLGAGETEPEWNIFDSQGTIFLDIIEYAGLFHYQAEFVYDITSYSDFHALLEKNATAAGILLPIRIHTETGLLTYRSDQRQHQTKHWVALNYLYEQDGQTWANVYNPYYNKYEDYHLSFIYTSWDFEVMIINPEDL